MTTIDPPEEFSKVMKDFVNDLKSTFPEYNSFIKKWWYDESDFEHIENEEEKKNACIDAEKQSMQLLFDYCQVKIPPRIFDILYQNEEIFQSTSEVDTELLPQIHFKNLWQYDISDKTKTTIWKYLQLIMFSIIGTLDTKDAFGDTAKLLKNIDQAEFKNKLEETLKHIQDLFSNNKKERTNEESVPTEPFQTADDTETNDSSEAKEAKFNIPDADDLHNHINGMMEGKLGKLAKEIAEETANDFGEDFDNVTDPNDIFQKLVNDPSKMMNLVKSVSEKLDTKIKSGQLKETEIISEATNLMNQMKNMPGMNNIQSMLSKMGVSGLGNLGNLAGLGGKVNTGAMEANLNNKMKMAKTKERIRAKAEANARAKLMQQMASSQLLQNNAYMIEQQRQQTIMDEEIVKIFSTGEKVEKTPRIVESTNDKKNKKKNKKE